jgi:hypothetical protein
MIEAFQVNLPDKADTLAGINWDRPSPGRGQPDG